MSNKRIHSWRFKESQRIFGLRIWRNLTIAQAASACGRTNKEYKAFEDGTNMKATKENYQEVYMKLKSACEDPDYFINEKELL